MADISISDLDNATLVWLQNRAKAHGWTIEEEVNRILNKVAQTWDEMGQLLADHPTSSFSLPTRPPRFDRKPLE